MNIDGLGENIIQQLLDRNLISNIADIYTLKFEDIASLKKNGKKFTEVEAMSLEGAAGRGWLIKFNESWYSNYKLKGELVKIWRI